MRIHRLHLPPPPTGEAVGSDQPPRARHAGSDRPGHPPPHRSASGRPATAASGHRRLPPAVDCTVAGDTAGADVTGTLSDYAIALSAPTRSAAAPTLRFRGT